MDMRRQRDWMWVCGVVLVLDSGAHLMKGVAHQISELLLMSQSVLKNRLVTLDIREILSEVLVLEFHAANRIFIYKYCILEMTITTNRRRQRNLNWLFGFNVFHQFSWSKWIWWKSSTTVKATVDINYKVLFIPTLMITNWCLQQHYISTPLKFSGWVKAKNCTVSYCRWISNFSEIRW